MYNKIPELYNLALHRLRYISSSYSTSRIYNGLGAIRRTRSLFGSRSHGLRTLCTVNWPLNSNRNYSFSSDEIPSKHALKFSNLYQLDTPEHDTTLSSQSETQEYQGNSPSAQSQIAILGGGISGLVTAYYINCKMPNVKIIIYESSNRLGGWLESEYVDIGKGRILLESGPRTLRYGTTSSLATAELIQDLGLENKIITTPKNSLAAKNRYIYYPDRLVRLPSPEEKFWGQISNILTEPIYEGAFIALLEFIRPSRTSDIEDESVASFFSRRLGGQNLVNNIHSAIIHGIYAGDVNQLSMRSLFPMLWYMEMHFDSLLKAIYKCSRNKRELVFPSELAARREIYPKIKPMLNDMLDKASVFSFQNGIETLSRALEEKLRAVPNIQFKINERVKSIEPTLDGIKVKTFENNCAINCNRVISALLPHQTSALSPYLPSLAQIPTVTVMIVSLYYCSATNLPVHGFGYLIPRSISYEQNPEFALGVVFDSDGIQGHDTVLGTKLTVMMGGHWWDGFSTYPDNEEGAKMAQALLKRHLGINREPDFVRVKLQRDCIPQYIVGHKKILSIAREEMSAFQGRLSVTGSGYRGVGVNDCVAAARSLANSMTSSFGLDKITGLEWLDEDLIQVKSS